MSKSLHQSQEVDRFGQTKPFGRGPVGRLLERLLAIDRLDDCYRGIDHAAGEHDDVHERALRQLGIDTEVIGDLADRLPAKGPVIVVANHPTGIAEGLILQAVIRRHRPDLKFMANGLLLRYPRFGRDIVAVDPFGGHEAARANVRGLKEARRWLDAGGVLGVFPAGSVAALEARRLQVKEGPWSDTIARLALRTGATVLPIHVTGSNGALFHAAGLLSRRLRTALLPQQLLNKRGRSFKLRVGRPIAPARIAALGSAERVTRYLHHQTMLLGQQRRRVATRRRNPTFLGALPIVAQAPAALRLAEFERIARRTELAREGSFSVHVAEAAQIPELLTEIGRLREETFRAVGEGTGQACDTDAFDSHYLHLFVWDHDRGEIAGAYRLRPTIDVQGRPEAAMLYTSRLFRYDDRFLERVGPALELGRSFVRQDYQSDYGSLYMLWRGIGAFLARNPRYRRLIGAVSMSASYREESRELLVSYLGNRHLDASVAALVDPPSPFRDSTTDTAWSPRELGLLAGDLREVSEMIEEIEGEGNGVPVLWRHYLKLGARVAAFNVDQDFGGVVDGLIVVDLDRTPMRHLQRYLGSEEAKSFRGLNLGQATPQAGPSRNPVA
ncbi:MAG: lysophospholipid acyltransferase family protein [Planctomycetes bacterium]|nr:lysophospholipid acyltransferase family protein [Planctomycetota bacterium]